MAPGTNRAGPEDEDEEEEEEEVVGGVLYTHSIPIHLRLRPQGQLVAGRRTGRRVRDTRRLCWVPPDTDVLPTSLEVKHTSDTSSFPSILSFIMQIRKEQLRNHKLTPIP